MHDEREPLHASNVFTIILHRWCNLNVVNLIRENPIKKLNNYLSDRFSSRDIVMHASHVFFKTATWINCSVTLHGKSDIQIVNCCIVLFNQRVKIKEAIETTDLL